MQNLSAALNTPEHREFAELLAEQFSERDFEEGSLVKGSVVSIENGIAIIDVGLKTEGRVPVQEFLVPGETEPQQPLQVGEEVEVYLERIENAYGEAVLSREKARREGSWQRLEAAFKNEEQIDGMIVGRVKGGFTVELGGIVGFLPGSQVDVRPVRDVAPLFNLQQPMRILKMDRRKGNIVVSRRVVLEETRKSQRSELLKSLEEGIIVEGVVRNITDYGGFVDIGGIDGLLHVTDLAWRRVSHPSEVLQVEQKIKVQVLRVNRQTERISLGLKQLSEDPWETISHRYPNGCKIVGKVMNITDYGAFVELEPGIEGLAHISEMSWFKRNAVPGKIVSKGQEVEVMVLDIDLQKHRISLGLKQCLENPWSKFLGEHPEKTTVTGTIRNITDFGMFLELDGELNGMVHLSDLDWSEPGDKAIARYNRGDQVEAMVLSVDIEKERINLGIKQLSESPYRSNTLHKNAVVTCVIEAVLEKGIEVNVGQSGLKTIIFRSELGRDRQDQRVERFVVGSKVDAMITQFDPQNRKLVLSIRALEYKEENEAVKQYGSSDSGAVLGDVLGDALGAAMNRAVAAQGAESSEDVVEDAAVVDTSVADATVVDTSAEAASVGDDKTEKPKPAPRKKAASKTKKAASVEDANVEDASVEDTSAEAASVEVASVEDDKTEKPKPAPRKKAASKAKKAASVEDANVEDTSVEVASVEDTSVGDDKTESPKPAPRKKAASKTKKAATGKTKKDES